MSRRVAALTPLLLHVVDQHDGWQMCRSNCGWSRQALSLLCGVGHSIRRTASRMSRVGIPGECLHRQAANRSGGRFVNTLGRFSRRNPGSTRLNWGALVIEMDDGRLLRALSPADRLDIYKPFTENDLRVSPDLNVTLGDVCRLGGPERINAFCGKITTELGRIFCSCHKFP